MLTNKPVTLAELNQARAMGELDDAMIYLTPLGWLKPFIDNFEKPKKAKRKKKVVEVVRAGVHETGGCRGAMTLESVGKGLEWHCTKCGVRFPTRGRK